MLNSLKYAKQLEKAGVSPEQAETHMLIIGEIMSNHLATQQDMKDLKQSLDYGLKDIRRDFEQSAKELRQDFEQSTNELRKDFEQSKKEFKQDLVQSEQRMTIRLGTIISLSIGVAVALAKIVG